jgi:hypothetical protein
MTILFSPTSGFFGSTAWCATVRPTVLEHQFVVHSQTLPIISYRPYLFGGKALTGEVLRKCERRSRGIAPCQMLAIV